MGSANYYAPGQWNFYCDLCGRKNKSGDAVLTWDNHYVCSHHKEARNPQDFVKGVPDNQSLPWTRANSGDGGGATPANAILDLPSQSPILDQPANSPILDTNT